MKIAITLTWSKIMAFVIFAGGLAFSLILLNKSDIETARSVFMKCTVVSAGLLGWRQVNTTAKTAIQTKFLKGDNDDRLSDKSSEVSVADA